MYIYNQKELSIFWGLPPTIPPLFSSYIKQKKITNGKNYYIKRDFNFRSISALQNLNKNKQEKYAFNKIYKDNLK